MDVAIEANKTCLLLDLPKDLRCRIWEHALTGEENVFVTSGRGRYAPWRITGLLRTCHLIRDEAEGIYFGKNRFMVSMSPLPARPPRPSFRRAYYWFQAIGKRNARTIRHLQFNAEPVDPDLALSLLQNFRNNVRDYMRIFPEMDEIFIPTLEVRTYPLPVRKP